jgi:hypothetical protein
MGLNRKMGRQTSGRPISGKTEKSLEKICLTIELDAKSGVLGYVHLYLLVSSFS